MKYGMVVHDMAISGGYQKLILRLSRGLAELGHSVVIYTIVVDRQKCYPDQIKQFEIVALREESRPGTIWDDYSDYRQLSKLMAPELNGLVIHDESSLQIMRFYRSQVPLRTAWMLNNQLTKGLIKPPGFSFFLNGGLKAFPKRVWLWPQVLFKSRLLRDCLNKVDAFATYDSFNQRLVEEELGRPATIVFAGADLGDFEKVGQRRSKAKSAKVLQVLSVGVSLPHRRYEDLIRAVKLVAPEHDIKLTVVGRSDLNAEYNKMLRDLVKSESLEQRVEFKDYVSDEAMHKLYEQADVFAFINDGETWGIAVFEAVAARLPVIITSNIGASDLIRDGREGWVVSARSPERIAQALEAIIRKPAEAKRRADQAWSHVSKIVTWSAYAQRMLELLKLPTRA